MCIRTYRTVELNKGLQHRSRYGRRREYQAAHTSRVYKNVFTIYIYVNVAHFYRCTLNSRTHVRTHARTLPATRRTSAPLAKSPYVVTFTAPAFRFVEQSESIRPYTRQEDWRHGLFPLIPQ